MAIDPHEALEQLIEALEEFHDAAQTADDPDSPRVLHAADDLADAYTVWDDALFTNFDVESPLDTFDEDFDDEDEDDDDYDEFDDEDFEDDDEFDDEDDDYDEFDDEDDFDDEEDDEE